MAQLIQERTFLRWKPRKTFVLVIANMSRSKYLFLELSYFNGFIKDRILENHRIICFSVCMYYIMFISGKKCMYLFIFPFLDGKKKAFWTMRSLVVPQGHPTLLCSSTLLSPRAYNQVPIHQGKGPLQKHSNPGRYPFIKVRGYH